MIERLLNARAGRWALIVASVLLLAMLAGSTALAQGDVPRKIGFGETVTGSLSEQSFAQVYTFDGQAGGSVTVLAISGSRGLGLALLLTDAGGRTLGQAANLSGPEISLQNIALPVTGPYYITVLRATGAQGQTTGQFSLSLSAGTPGPSPTPTPPPLVRLNQGLTIALSWESIDDMDIEIRDPVGGSVFFRNVEVPSGGRLRANVNNGCQNTVNNPTEVVSWPRGNVPAGSYEILVYYNRACRQPAQPNTFRVIVNVNGRAQQEITGQLNVGEQYVASFILDSADQVTINQGGANPLLLNLQPFAERLANPTALGDRPQVQSRIDRNNSVDVWSFEATQGQIATVSMDALDGSLDPQLILLGPDNGVVASNDDASAETRNSLIANQPLPVTGQYRIVATRFGKNIGGTEGRYLLTLTLSGGGAVAGGTAPAAPAGTPVGGAVTATPGAGSIAGQPAGSIEIALIWNNRSDMRLLIRDPQNRSLFSDNTQLADGARITRQDNLNCQNQTVTPLTYAFWPVERLLPGTYEVQVWMNSQCDEPILPTYTLTANVRGRQVIAHTDQPDVNRNFYVITFTVDNAGNATAGQGGIFTRNLSTDIGDITGQVALAPALVYGRPITGAIDAANTFSVFTFQARAGDRLRISMRATRGNLDPFVYLLDSNAIQIGQNDDAGANDRNSRLDAVIPADGAYIIVATRFGATFGGTAGAFELLVAPVR